MKLKDYLAEATNIAIQFFDDYDENTDKIVKMVEYTKGSGDKKTFPLDKISDKIPNGVIVVMKKAIKRETGIDLDSIEKFKSFVGRNFKYKDGVYDISFTISGEGNKKRGSSNIDKGELRKAISGKKSPAEEKQLRKVKDYDKKDFLGKKRNPEKQKDVKHRRKKQHDILSREIERARNRSKG